MFLTPRSRALQKIFTPDRASCDDDCAIAKFDSHKLLSARTRINSVLHNKAFMLSDILAPSVPTYSYGDYLSILNIVGRMGEWRAVHNC
jgi:hypothetical protein